MTLENLNQLDIFSALDPQSINHIRRLMKRHEVPEGWVLFREGDMGTLMYIVLSGTVAISITADNSEELEVARVGSGSFFGEMSILEKDVRSATCRTVEDCVLLSLDAEDFGRLMVEHPRVAMGVMQRMLNTATSRLQKTGAFLSDMVQWGEQARIRAVSDEFTGMYNRRFFDETLHNSVLSASMGKGHFALVMMDLDRFGTLNAEYGEKVGDEVILKAVSACRAVFEKEHLLCRYGGDEFAFILPGASGEDALKYCQKLKTALEKIDVLKGREGSIQKVSASIGIAACPGHGESVEELARSADLALYAAKEAGRDRAMLYNGEEMT